MLAWCHMPASDQSTIWFDCGVMSLEFGLCWLSLASHSILIVSTYLCHRQNAGSLGAELAFAMSPPTVAGTLAYQPLSIARPRVSMSRNSSSMLYVLPAIVILA